MERRTVLRGIVAGAAGVAGATALGGTAWADSTVTLNNTTSWSWEGWGTSLAWWGKNFGDRDDLADLFFGQDTANYQGSTIPSLRLNIVRYNAGACTTHSIGSRSMQPGVSAFKAVEAYQNDWYSADPASTSWNWAADATQRAMLLKAKSRGADTFELFSNSPVWWMLDNDNPTGAADGGNNLQDQNYGRHAAYLATIVRYAADNWGIDFTSVEPVNEPTVRWSLSGGNGQEGCFFSQDKQAQAVNALRGELDARSLGGTLVSGTDEWGYSYALSTWNSPYFDAATKANVGRINVHGYETGGRRDLLASAAAQAGKKIWMSEYCDPDASGMRLVSNLNLDLTWLRPTAWVYWQVLDGPSWGVVDLVDNVPGAVNTKYYVLAQYTRHIRPGMRIIDSGDGNTITAYDAANHKLIVIATNWGTGQWISFDLARFGTPSADGALVDRWCTNTGGGDSYQHHQDTYMHGTRFWSWFNPNTVQTFEVPGVYL